MRARRAHRRGVRRRHSVARCWTCTTARSLAWHITSASILDSSTSLQAVAAVPLRPDLCPLRLPSRPRLRLRLRALGVRGHPTCLLHRLRARRLLIIALVLEDPFPFHDVEPSGAAPSSTSSLPSPRLGLRPRICACALSSVSRLSLTHHASRLSLITRSCSHHNML